MKCGRIIKRAMFGLAAEKPGRFVGSFFGRTLNPPVGVCDALRLSEPFNNFPSLVNAWQVCNGLRVSINEPGNRQREQAITVADFFDHYIKAERWPVLGDR